MDFIDSYSHTVNTWMAQISKRRNKILKILRERVMRQICEANGSTSNTTTAISNPFNDTLDDLDDPGCNTDEDDGTDEDNGENSAIFLSSSQQSQRNINGVCYSTGHLLLNSANANVLAGSVCRR